MADTYTLRELEAEFIRRTPYEDTWEVQLPDGSISTKTGTRECHTAVETLAEAQGVEFLCPICFQQNGGSYGTHHVICWSRSRGVPDSVVPGPGRWTLDGTSLDDLTLNGDPPGTARSIKLTSGCAWHGCITNGRSSDA